jgi:hypothetical protein
VTPNTPTLRTPSAKFRLQRTYVRPGRGRAGRGRAFPCRTS